jgi:hypothetical protein
VADSDALRARRYRQCKQGDHSLCRHGSGAWLTGVPVAPVTEAAAGDFDPAEEMRRLAGRLAASYRADTGNAALARELRMTLLAIKAPDQDQELAELMRSFGEPS